MPQWIYIQYKLDGNAMALKLALEKAVHAINFKYFFFAIREWHFLMAKLRQGVLVSCH